MNKFLENIGWCFLFIGIALLIKSCDGGHDKPLMGCNGSWVNVQCK